MVNQIIVILLEHNEFLTSSEIRKLPVELSEPEVAWNSEHFWMKVVSHVTGDYIQQGLFKTF